MDIGSIASTIVGLADNPILTVPAGAGTTIGAYVVRSAQARTAAKLQIATQLIDLQRNLADLAFADRNDDIDWSEVKPEWARRMIFGQFFSRFDDMKNLAVREKLDPSVVALISAHRDTVSDFSDKWFNTKRRVEGSETGFWNSYNDTKSHLHKTLKAIGKFKKIEKVIKDGGFENIDSSRNQEGNLMRNPMRYSTKENS
jgi:hypothetical protein